MGAKIGKETVEYYLRRGGPRPTDWRIKATSDREAVTFAESWDEIYPSGIPHLAVRRTVKITDVVLDGQAHR
jgi:hypothetical protein